MHMLAAIHIQKMCSLLTIDGDQINVNSTEQGERKCIHIRCDIELGYTKVPFTLICSPSTVTSKHFFLQLNTYALGRIYTKVPFTYRREN